jgi:hypothetical protein
MQHRTVLVGHPRRVIEGATDETAKPIEMRLDMLEQIFGQMDAQEIGQRRVGTVEIHAGRIGRDQISSELSMGVHDDLLCLADAFPSSSCASHAIE